MRPGWIAGNGLARADVPCDHAAGPDHGPVADGDAGQEYGAAADPDVAADPHRAAEFDAGAPCFRVARVVGGIDLRGRTNLRAVADHDFDHVEDDAVEIEEDLVTR